MSSLHALMIVHFLLKKKNPPVVVSGKTVETTDDFEDNNSFVSRGCDPFGQHRGSIILHTLLHNE